MILHYFIKKENKENKIAENIYKTILKISNQIINEYNYFKDKNYNSSFEVVSIFLIIYIKTNINKNITNYKIINESLISIFISDLDESLRTKGIGDMSIGKYVKSYVKKFYFRLSRFPEIKEEFENISIEKYLKLFDFVEENKIKLASSTILKFYKKIEQSKSF